MGQVTKLHLQDGLVNVTAGLGGERDKAALATWGTPELDADQIRNAYRGDGLTRKVIDAPAFDMVREWRNWQAKPDEIETLEKTERLHNIRQKVFKAKLLARLFGGAGIVIGIRGQDIEKPLEPETIRKDSLQWVHVMHRYLLSGDQPRLDPADPWFGEPEFYHYSTYQGRVFRVHPSRVVRFIGAERPDVEIETDGWGDSVLLAIDSALKNASATIAGVASLVYEAKVDVLRIPDLSESLATEEYTALLTTRLKNAAKIKSMVNALVLDKEEEYDQKQVSFDKLPEIIQQYLQIVAGVADIPMTRLLGQSPAGMNATGESDMRNYYDRIASEQELTLTPPMSRLDEVIIRSSLGKRDESIHYLWAPLYQTSDKDHAEIENKRADTFSKIATTGLIPDEVLGKAQVNAMIESGQFPGLEAAMEEFGDLTQHFEEEPVDPNELNDPSMQGVPGEDPLMPEPGNAKQPIDPKTGKPVTDAAPRTLYVYRRVLNAKAIVAWAKRQGFASTLKPSDMHVTIIYSKEPVDWIKAGTEWSRNDDGKLTIPAGGPRVVEPLGPKGAVVLHFASNDLIWRHEDIMRRTGASWDWDDFQPHITITYEGAADVDFSKIAPFTGKIELGEEVFEAVVEDWEKGRG